MSGSFEVIHLSCIVDIVSSYSVVAITTITISISYNVASKISRTETAYIAINAR